VLCLKRVVGDTVGTIWDEAQEIFGARGLEGIHLMALATFDLYFPFDEQTSKEKFPARAAPVFVETTGHTRRTFSIRPKCDRNKLPQQRKN
jgi:hypothetical protein